MSESVPFDDRAHAYLRSGDIAAAVARQHFKIKFDGLTRVRAREVMGLLREVDTLVDDTDISDSEVLTMLESFELFAPRYPHLTPEALGPEVQTVMLERTKDILDHGHFGAQTSSMWDLADSRASEGYESVQFIGDCATAEVRAHPAFSQFMHQLGAIGAAATLWDSLVDGRQDFKAGKQRIEPNAEYYRVVARNMLYYASGNIGCLLHPGPLYYVGMKGIDRVINRIRNGIPSYSTMYRFIRRSQ